MKQLSTFSLLLLTASVTGGCAQTEERTLTGTLDQASFPAAVSSIAVMQGEVKIAEAQPADDGSFSFTLSTGTGYHIDLTAGDTTLPLVIPRLASAGSSDFALDVSFGVPEEDDLIDLHALFERVETLLGEETETPKGFELGTLRYLADPFGTTYLASEDEAADCVDGVDSVTGARCVDPGPSETAPCLEDTTDTAYTEAEPLDASVTAGVLADRSIPLVLCGGGRHGDDGDGGGDGDEDGDHGEGGHH
jgi:hypothetical protein